MVSNGGHAEVWMTWTTLFDRAANYDMTDDDLEAAIAAVRDSRESENQE